MTPLPPDPTLAIRARRAAGNDGRHQPQDREDIAALLALVDAAGAEADELRKVLRELWEEATDSARVVRVDQERVVIGISQPTTQLVVAALGDYFAARARALLGGETTK